MSAEKWTEIERDVVDKLRDYIDEQVKSADGVHGEFFQIMEDLVLPVLESCIEHDIIDDKHLDSHINELSEFTEDQDITKLNIIEMRQIVNAIERRLK